MKFWEKIKCLYHDVWPSCLEASRGQSEQFEHRLSSGKRLGLWFHLLLCKWCRRYGRQISFLRLAANNHTEALTEASPKKLSAAARERINQRLSEER